MNKEFLLFFLSGSNEEKPSEWIRKARHDDWNTSTAEQSHTRNVCIVMYEHWTFTQQLLFDSIQTQHTNCGHFRNWAFTHVIDSLMNISKLTASDHCLHTLRMHFQWFLKHSWWKKKRDLSYYSENMCESFDSKFLYIVEAFQAIMWARKFWGRKRDEGVGWGDSSWKLKIVRRAKKGLQVILIFVILFIFISRSHFQSTTNKQIVYLIMLLFRRRKQYD